MREIILHTPICVTLQSFNGFTIPKGINAGGSCPHPIKAEVTKLPKNNKATGEPGLSFLAYNLR